MPPRGRVQVSISADSSGLQRGVAESEASLGKLGTAGAKVNQKIGESAKGATGHLAGLAKAALGTAAAYASIAGAKEAVDTTEELAHATLTLHKNLGLSVKSASEWAAVAKVRGIDSKQLSQAFGTLSKNVEAGGLGFDKMNAKLAGLGSTQKDQAKIQKILATGAGAQADALKKLGASQDEIKRGNFQEILTTVADGFGKLHAGTEKTTLGMKLFGRGWQTVLPVLRDGSKAMNEQLALADKYGVTFHGKTVKSLEELIQAQRESKFATLGLQVAFGTQLAPVLTKAIQSVTKLVAGFRDGTGAGGQLHDQLDKIVAVLKPIAKFLGDHPKLIAGAVAAWATYRAASIAATTAARVKLIATFLGLAPKAAVGGAEAGAAFGGAASAEAGTKMRGFGWAGLGGRIGTALGVAAGVAAAVEVANALSKTQFVQGIADSIGSALGIIDPKSVRDARDRSNRRATAQRKATIKHPVASGTTGPTISLPQVAAGHHSGVVTHHPKRAPHPGTRAHGAVAHTSAVHPAVVAHAARAATGRPAGRYTAPMLARLWVQAGGPASVADTAAAIALAESGGDPGIVNSIGATGLWQIHPGGQQYLDPMANARAAVAKYKAARGFTPWTTYTGADTPGHAQTYKAFLGQSGGAGARATAGSGGTSAPSPPTAADYARNAAHRVAPITSAFGHASGIYGGINARAGTSVETYTHDIGEAQRVFGRHPVDLNTVTGRMQHIFDLTSIRGLQTRKLAAQRRQVAAKRQEITLKRQEITRLMAALRRGSRHQRPAIRAKVKGLQADIRTLKADIRQLGFDIDDSVQDVADTDTEISTTEAGPQDPQNPLTGTAAIPGADAYQSILNRDAALAALTPDTGDDLDVAKRQQAAAQAILTYEQAHPGQFTPDDVAQAATNLKSANDTVTQLAGTGADAVDANTQALHDLRDELKRQNDFASSVANVTSLQAVRALADIISGQITGTGYDPRAMTAGAGALARY